MPMTDAELRQAAKEMQEARELLSRAAREMANAQAAAETMAGVVPEGRDGERFVPLEEMDGQLGAVEWLWPGWIPRGMVTVLAAAPGIGKSLVALDLARRLLAGETWPDGTPQAGAGRSVILVDAEGIPTVINERAKAWGMDRRRLYLMRPPKPAHVINLTDTRHFARLAQMAGKLRPALVVVDSLSAATAGGESSLKQARLVLTLLGAMAEGLNAGMLVIHHLRKGAPRGGQQAGAGELRGTSHLSAAARSVMTLVPVRPGARELRLEVVKSNLCEPPPPLYVAIAAGEGGAPVLRTQVHPTEETECEAGLLAGEAQGLCARWLVAYLAAAGPSRPRDAVTAAEEAGFSRRTVYRARQGLGERIEEVGRGLRDPGKVWRVADDLEHGRRGTGAKDAEG